MLLQTYVLVSQAAQYPVDEPHDDNLQLINWVLSCLRNQYIRLKKHGMFSTAFRQQSGDGVLPPVCCALNIPGLVLGIIPF